MRPTNSTDLAINGGPKLRSTPMPYRKLFGEEEFEMVKQVFEDAWERGVDFSFQNKFEDRYMRDFCAFQGGGFADAVSSGTAAIYVAFAALKLEPGSDVVVSPVTNSGGVTPAILQGHRISIADAQPDDFNVGPDQFEKALTSNTKAAILTHSGGHPIDMAPIMEIARARGIKIVEDCSQAHGALYRGKRVGRFGDFAVFSTGFSKNHATGGCGGIVYTQNEDLYWIARSQADRGKPFRTPNADLRNAVDYHFAAMNFNNDELSCAIGISTLARLPAIIEQRQLIADKLDRGLERGCKAVYPCKRRPGDTPSIFFHTVRVDPERLSIGKKAFGEALAAEGITVNYHYDEVTSTWKWLKQYLAGPSETPNAVRFRDTSINILFNERYTDTDINDVIECIKKVESVYLK